MDALIAKATALKEAGNKQLAAKKYAAAEESYTAAIALGELPDTYIYYSNRSGVRVELKNFAGAAEDARDCIELKPGWAKGYLRLGAALQGGGGSAAAAVEAYEKGLALEPGNADLKKALAAAKKLAEIEAKAAVAETGDRLRAGVKSKDGQTSIVQAAEVAKQLVDVAALGGVVDIARDFLSAHPKVALAGGAGTPRGRYLVASRDIAYNETIMTEAGLAWYGPGADRAGACIPAVVERLAAPGEPGVGLDLDAVLLQLDPFYGDRGPASAVPLPGEVIAAMKLDAAATEAAALDPHLPPFTRGELYVKAFSRNALGAIISETMPNEQRVISVLAPAVAMLNHSCAPNARVAFGWDGAKGAPVARVYCTHPAGIPAGTEVSIAYIDPRLAAADRKRALAARYGFDCGCGRCTSGVDDARVLKCTACGTGRAVIGTASCLDCGADITEAARPDGKLAKARAAYFARPKTMVPAMLEDAAPEVPVHISDAHRLEPVLQRLPDAFNLEPATGVKVIDALLAAMRFGTGAGAACPLPPRQTLMASLWPQILTFAGHTYTVAGPECAAKARECYAEAAAIYAAAFGASSPVAKLFAKTAEKPPASRPAVEKFELARREAFEWASLNSYGVSRAHLERWMSPLAMPSGAVRLLANGQRQLLPSKEESDAFAALDTLQKVAKMTLLPADHATIALNMTLEAIRAAPAMAAQLGVPGAAGGGAGAKR